MKKTVKSVCDIACCVGSSVGVGFLSGKEAQVFFGNYVNVAIFAVTFAAVTFVLREFCRRTASSTVGKMSQNLLRKKALWGSAAVAFCSFVCIVATLAGVQQYLFTLAPTRFPLFAFATALLAALILGKMGWIKLLNVISVAMAAALILFGPTKGAGAVYTAIPCYQPITFALFSATAALGLTCKFASDSTQGQNALSATVSAAVIALLMCAILPKCNLALPQLSGFWRIFAIATLLLAAVTGAVANALPVLELIGDVVGDESLSRMLVLGSALALSMLGLDFAVKAGYTIVALLGGALTLLAASKLASKQKSAAFQPRI